jgi:hypothetical protein
MAPSNVLDKGMAANEHPGGTVLLLQLGLGQRRVSPAFSAASSFRRLGPSACPRTARARRSGLRLEVTQAAAEGSRLMYQACALSLPVEARRQGRAKRARPLGVLSWGRCWRD